MDETPEEEGEACGLMIPVGTERRRGSGFPREGHAGERDDALDIDSIGQTASDGGEKTGAIDKDALGNFFAGFAEDQFFAVDKGEHGVGRCLSGFDEVTVDHHGSSIETS
jgi:hypothetical protein